MGRRRAGPPSRSATASRRVVGVHVVEQQPVGLGAERGGDLLEVAALDLDREVRLAARAAATASARPPARATWFSLIRIASKRPMRWLTPPPAATACFSSARRPGSRLAGVEDPRPGPGDRLDEARGQGGDAREVAEQVERGPLRRQQPRRRAGGEGDVGRHRLAPAGPRRPGCRPSRPRTGASPRRRPRARRPRPAASGRSSPCREPRRERSPRRSRRPTRRPRPAPGRRSRSDRRPSRQRRSVAERAFPA